MQPVNPRPNQATIAKQMGVSVSTVSRALANEPGISDPVRLEIQRLARSLGYQAKRTPAAGGRPKTVALVPLNGASGGLAVFYEGIVSGMRAAARDAGLDLDLRLVNEAYTTPEEVERQLSQAGAGSLMLLGIDPSAALADWLFARRINVVLVNGSDPTMRFSTVSPANFYGARMATEQLLAAGHRRILHTTYDNRYTLHERVRGFEAAIAATPGASGHVVKIGPGDRPPAVHLMADLAAKGDDFTAVFCVNDLVAVEVLEAASRGSIPVPDTFSVIGFDDLPCAAMWGDRLSTMRVDREAIGRNAVHLLMDRHAGSAADGPARQIELGVTFVEGGTIIPRKR